jgi:hypothetical protein
MVVPDFAAPIMRKSGSRHDTGSSDELAGNGPESYRVAGSGFGGADSRCYPVIWRDPNRKGYGDSSWGSDQMRPVLNDRQLGKQAALALNSGNSGWPSTQLTT